ncbi:MAG: hypothetical protein EXR41_05435 [Candidatus Methylopumilus sp.]|nr:hypothetical protein [Candidatus Methylopumilus sp.]
MASSNNKELLLKAISYAINDAWDESHKIVQELHSLDAYWIHGVLHKIEGDEFNSRYWYERAQQSYDRYKDSKKELQFIEAQL